MKLRLPLCAALAVLGISACTTSEKVAVKQPADLKMSCGELEQEFVKLDAVMEDAEGDRGVNTANVAAVVFFWPAAVGNYMNAKDAEELVAKRRDYLMGLYTDKNCAAES